MIFRGYFFRHNEEFGQNSILGQPPGELRLIKYFMLMPLVIIPASCEVAGLSSHDSPHEPSHLSDIQTMPTLISKKKPRWLKQRLPSGPDYERTRALLKKNGIHTVCREARCPNLWECFSKKTATFLIMGPSCTRNCAYCAVEHGPLKQADTKEPARVAAAAKELGLSYVVVTSVTRDDLPDGGASLFRDTINELRKAISNVTVEILIPDFEGNPVALKTVVQARPHVVNHNIETCSRLYPIARPQASYSRSLGVLKQIHAFNAYLPIKSGLMLGLGETYDEIIITLEDLLEAGCTFLTMGQYLQPSKEHLPVTRFVHPNEFEDLRKKALEMGFSKVAGGPLVRSSYHAADLYSNGLRDAEK